MLCRAFLSQEQLNHTLQKSYHPSKYREAKLCTALLLEPHQLQWFHFVENRAALFRVALLESLHLRLSSHRSIPESRSFI